MGDLGQRLDVRDIQLGVAQGLGVNGPRLVVDQRAQPVEVVRVDEFDGNSPLGKGVVKEVVGSAIERGGGDDLFPSRGQRRQSQGFSRLPRGRRQPRRSAFQSRHPLLEDIVGGVHDAGINVAELLQSKEPSGMTGVMEDIRSGLVDGHGARTRGWVGHLTSVDGKSGKLKRFRFGHGLLLQITAIGLVNAAETGTGRTRQAKRPESTWDSGRQASESVAFNA